MTRHIRDNKCKFDSSATVTAYFPCGKCPYKTDSQADYFFHEALHTEPLVTYDPKTGRSLKKSLYKYKCPVCYKIFKKASLRCHVRLHCKERPYACTLCKNTYARSNNLMDHIKHQHGERFAGRKKLVCSFCDFNCNDRWVER